MLLVVHGAGSYGLSFRDGAFTSSIEEKYAVAYFDHRGQSMSQGHQFETENIEQLLAEDLSKVLLLLKSKYGEGTSFFLLGHSWGGTLCTLALLEENFQSQLNGWIHLDGVHNFLLAGSSRKDFLIEIANEGIDRGSIIEDWENIKTKLDPLDPASTDDYPIILSVAREVTFLLTKEEIVNSGISTEKSINAVIRNNPISWFAFQLQNKPHIQANNEDLALSHLMNKITLPTIMMWGKYDVSVPIAVAHDGFMKIGSVNKEIEIFERSIHHPHDTEPDKFGELLISFIERFK